MIRRGPGSALLAAAMLLACGGVAWDPSALSARYPELTALDAGLLGELHPFVLPAAGEVVFFTCRWETSLPLAVGLPATPSTLEQRALETALRAWEASGLGMRLVRVGGEGTVTIELADEAVATARGRGSGNTIADCHLQGPGLAHAGRERLPAELRSARVRVARRTPPDPRGRVRTLALDELTGVLVHELGHALGWQGHVRRGASPMRPDVDSLRRLGSALLDGARLEAPALRALYALPNGSVLSRVPVGSARTRLVDRLARLAELNHLEGPFARVGDVAARLYWRRRTTEYGLQVINLEETLRRPERIVVAPEARALRELAPVPAWDAELP